MKLSVSRHASVCSPNHRASDFELEGRGTETPKRPSQKYPQGLKKRVSLQEKTEQSC